MSKIIHIEFEEDEEEPEDIHYAEYLEPIRQLLSDILPSRGIVGFEVKLLEPPNNLLNTESLWNQACDIAMNLNLKQRGFEPPSHARVDEKFKEMNVAEIYRELRREKG